MKKLKKKLENILNFAYHLKIKFNFKNVKKLYHFKAIFGHIFKLILKKFLIKQSENPNFQFDLILFHFDRLIEF